MIWLLTTYLCPGLRVELSFPWTPGLTANFTELRRVKLLVKLPQLGVLPQSEYWTTEMTETHRR